MSVELASRPLGHAHATAIVAATHADAGRLVVLGIDDRHVGDVDPRLALDDPELGLGVGRVRALVALDHVQALDEDLVGLAVDPQDLPGLALVLARDDDHVVVAADAQRGPAGASETIFMKPPSRSARATGPKMRVPRGLFWVSMITAAFSSNAMYVPSSRPNSFFVRTTTALTTSPFLTVPFGLACLTVATMMSPPPA